MSSEIEQVVWAMLENQQYLIDLLCDPNELKRWEYVLNKTPHNIKQIAKEVEDV